MIEMTMPVEEQEISQCRHHWVIETPNGAVSRGRCKRCGAIQEFYNSMPETSYWDDDSSKGSRWGHRGHDAEEGTAVSVGVGSEDSSWE